MIIDNVCMLASDTARSKAYLQKMIDEDVFPKYCIVYTDDVNKIKEETDSFVKRETKPKYFDKDMSILKFLECANIKYEIFGSKDINAPEFLEKIKSLPMKYLIYSGYGGYILKSHLFNIGKKYIHVHAGILPSYRGSTTAYYSMLEKDYIGASAIFLNEKIDEGALITSEKFPLPKEMVDIDLEYELYLWAKVLLKALKIYAEDGKFPESEQKTENARTYFVIHPVLKHLAIMKYYGQQ